MREAPRYRVPLEPRASGGVAWLPNDWLIESRDADPDGLERLFRLRPDGSGLEQLAIPEDPVCLAIRHLSPISLEHERRLLSECEARSYEFPGQWRDRGFVCPSRPLQERVALAEAMALALCPVEPPSAKSKFSSPANRLTGGIPTP